MTRRQVQLIGLVGSLLVALGSCGTAFSANPAGWPADWLNVLGFWQPRAVSATLISVGTLIVGVAWLAAGRLPLTGVQARTLLALWCLPVLLVPPVTSADPFLYADLGYIVGHGGNPYVVGLGGMAGPYAAWVDAFWRGHGVAYPPLTLELSRVLVTLAGGDPYLGVVAQRLPALVGIALLAMLLPKVAARLGVDPARATWLGMLNPVIVLHFAGGGHNDALMVGVVVAALWLALQRVRLVSASLVLAPIVLGLAMGLKQQAVIAALAVAGVPVVERLRALALWPRLTLLAGRSLVVLVVSLATFVLTSWASGLGFGWVGWLGEMGRARTITPAILLDDATSWAGLELLGPAFIGQAVLAAVLALWWFVTHTDDPLRVSVGGSVAALFVAQALHPWYLGICLALFAACRVTPTVLARATWATLGYVLAYTVQFTFWIPPWWALAWTFPVIWLLWHAWHRPDDSTDRPVVRASQPEPPVP